MVANGTTIDSRPRCRDSRTDDPVKCWVLGNIEIFGVLVERHRRTKEAIWRLMKNGSLWWCPFSVTVSRASKEVSDE